MWLLCSQAQAALKALVGEGAYLCVTLPDTTRLVHPIMPGERSSCHDFGACYL